MQNDNVTPTLDDDQIYQEALLDWLDVLSRLWTAYGKPLDPAQMTIYWDMLCRLPRGLLEQAIDRVVREHTYNTVPTVAEVWQAVRKELGNPYDIDQAIRDWRERTWHSMIVQFPAVEIVAVETEEMVEMA